MSRSTETLRIGTFLGVPYDWRWPTVAQTTERWSGQVEPRHARLFGRKPKAT